MLLENEAPCFCCCSSNSYAGQISWSFPFECPEQHDNGLQQERTICFSAGSLLNFCTNGCTYKNVMRRWVNDLSYVPHRLGECQKIYSTFGSQFPYLDKIVTYSKLVNEKTGWIEGYCNTLTLHLRGSYFS